MTDRSIKSELKEVQKKLDDIEKKQEMLNKIQQLDRDRRRSSRGSNHRCNQNLNNTFKSSRKSNQ